MSHRRRAVVALLCGAVAIAFAPIFVRWSEAGPIATAFYRTALAWPVLLLWLHGGPATARPGPLNTSHYAGLVLAGVFFACDLAAWHWSIQLTSVANATLLANLAPVFVTLGGWLFLGNRAGRRFVHGLALAMTGLALLSGASMSLGSRHLAGDLLAVLTAVFYGAYILTISQLRRHLPTAVIMSHTALVASLVLLLLTLLSGETIFGLSASGWLVVCALAWFSHAGGQGLITYALAHLPANYSSLVLVLQPVLAALLAWYLFGEQLDALQLLGALVVLAGIVLASRRELPA